MLLILKLRSFLFSFVSDHGNLFLKISLMQVVCTCYCYNFHIFLREYSSQKYNSNPEGCPVDWQDLMMVLAVQ